MAIVWVSEAQSSNRELNPRWPAQMIPHLQELLLQRKWPVVLMDMFYGKESLRERKFFKLFIAESLDLGFCSHDASPKNGTPTLGATDI